jgi:predicted SAM-dependent methyltransferase
MDNIQDSRHNARDYYSFNNPLSGLAANIGLQTRMKIYKVFLELHSPNGSHKVIDVGVTPDESFAESNFFEELYPYKHNITAAGIEDASHLEKKYGGIRFLKLKPNKENDLIDEKNNTKIQDNTYDILFCNAVLEHVGSREQQKRFFSECVRISRQAFITTPNRWFPVEMHTIIPFLHWLPMKIFRKILKILKKDFMADEQNLNLFTFKELKEMIKESGTLEKCHANISYRHVRTWLWPSHICMSIVKGNSN